MRNENRCDGTRLNEPYAYGASQPHFFHTVEVSNLPPDTKFTVESTRSTSGKPRISITVTPSATASDRPFKIGIWGWNGDTEVDPLSETYIAGNSNDRPPLGDISAPDDNKENRLPAVAPLAPRGAAPLDCHSVTHQQDTMRCPPIIFDSQGSQMTIASCISASAMGDTDSCSLPGPPEDDNTTAKPHCGTTRAFVEEEAPKTAASILMEGNTNGNKRRRRNRDGPAA